MSPSTYELLPPIELEERGLCSRTDPKLWFSDRLADTNAAKRTCHRCPMEAVCLEWAVEKKERYGVWGGVSERKRRKMIVARHGPKITAEDRETIRGSDLSANEIAETYGISTKYARDLKANRPKNPNHHRRDVAVA